jgi:hypothetical protein
MRFLAVHHGLHGLHVNCLEASAIADELGGDENRENIFHDSPKDQLKGKKQIPATPPPRIPLM